MWIDVFLAVRAVDAVQLGAVDDALGAALDVIVSAPSPLWTTTSGSWAMLRALRLTDAHVK